MDPHFSGRVWKFGDNVDTDVMAPWNSLDLPIEERTKVTLHIRPEFATTVRPGDIIVAGRNWGCGSSREQAPENLRALGVAAVVAESFGRIYFRTCIAMAFPNVVCPGIAAAFEDGDTLELDLAASRVRNRTRSIELQSAPYAPEMLRIIERGGLMNLLKRRLGTS